MLKYSFLTKDYSFYTGESTITVKELHVYK